MRRFLAACSPHMIPSIQDQKLPQVFLTVVLTVILGIAAYVRLLGLGAESFWLDEGYSLAYTELPFRKMIAYIATRDVHPPLYYILFKIWRNTGDSEMWLRLPSTVFGIAAVAYMWSMVDEHWGASAAAASSLLLATSEMAIWYSQEARMYSLLLLLSVLSIKYFLRFITPFQFPGDGAQNNAFPRATAMDCLGLAFFTLTLLYTHNVAVFLWGTQLLVGGMTGVLPFIRSRRSRTGCDIGNPVFRNSVFRQWLLCQAVIGAVYLPWIHVLFGQSANVLSRFWIEPPNMDSVWNAFRIPLVWGSWNDNIIWDVTKIIVLIVAVKTVVNFRDVKGMILGMFVILPVLMSYLYSVFRSPILLERSLIFMIVPLLALIGSFLTIPGAGASFFKKSVGVLQVAVGVLLFAFLVHMNLAPWRIELDVQSKEDFRTAATNALRFADGSTAVVFNNSATQAAFDYYFHRSVEVRSVDEHGVPCHYLEVPEGNANLEPLVTRESIAELDRKLSARQRVVLVRSYHKLSDPSGLLKGYFDSNWRFDRDLSAKGVEMLLYTRR